MIERDLIKLDHLGDLGMSEMMLLMRVHVQEVTRFTTLLAMNMRLSRDQEEQFLRDCDLYEINPHDYISTNGRDVSFSPAGILLLKICAKVHDIGKPFFRHIYALSRSLSYNEFNCQKLHSNMSRIIVKSWLLDRTLALEHPGLIKFVADMAASHQEKYDGSGYPDGKTGEGIGLIGRILAITDTVS